MKTLIFLFVCIVSLALLAPMQSCKVTTSDAKTESVTSEQAKTVSVEVDLFDQLAATLSKYWYFIIVVYEIAARLFKSKSKYWSVVELIYKIITLIVPNRATENNSGNDPNGGKKTILKTLFGKLLIHS